MFAFAVKDKYGDDVGDSESSTDYSSEDSEAEFVTPEVDAAILKIIGKIRQKDSSLYAANGRDFFDGELAVWTGLPHTENPGGELLPSRHIILHRGGKVTRKQSQSWPVI